MKEKACCPKVFVLELVSQFGLGVTCWAGKQKGLGSIPQWLSLLFEKVVVCGHCLVTLSLTINKKKKRKEKKEKKQEWLLVF